MGTSVATSGVLVGTSVSVGMTSAVGVKVAVAASVVAVGVAVCRASLPLAMCLVAVSILVRGFIPAKPNRSGFLMVAGGILGFLCGARASIVALGVLVPLFILLKAAYNKSTSS